MNDTRIIKTYLKKTDFKILAFEMLDNSYENFCTKIMENDFTEYLNFLASIKDVLILKRFLDDIKNSNLKNKDYSSVLEIVLFVSMIEGYMSDNKYINMESYLKNNFTNNMTKKQLKSLIIKYQQENSLSAKVRDFMNKGPFLDNLYFSSCFENDKQIKKLGKSSLNLLVFILGKGVSYQQQLNLKKDNQKIKVLKELQKSLKNKTGKTSLSVLHDHFKSFKTEGELLKSMKTITNKLYDIRSKFLHTGEKKSEYSFFLDKEKGNIFDFSDIDLFRYFLRTLLLIHGFKLDVTKISSKDSL